MFMKRQYSLEGERQCQKITQLVVSKDRTWPHGVWKVTKTQTKRAAYYIKWMSTECYILPAQVKTNRCFAREQITGQCFSERGKLYPHSTGI